MRDLTVEEMQVQDNLVLAWNNFVALPKIGSVANSEMVDQFRFHINALHCLVYSRPGIEQEFAGMRPMLTKLKETVEEFKHNLADNMSLGHLGNLDKGEKYWLGVDLAKPGTSEWSSVKVFRQEQGEPICMGTLTNVDRNTIHIEVLKLAKLYNIPEDRIIMGGGDEG